MKILYLIHKVEVPCHQHIINFLRYQGVDVTVKTIGPVVYKLSRNGKKVWTNVWNNIKNKKYINNVINNHYDFIVSNTHSSFLKNFYHKVKPKYGYVDVAHDLFNGIPEHFPNSMVPVFHEKHATWCKKNGRKFIKCRWFKLDADFKRADLSIDVWNEAILIGSYVFNQDESPINTYGFDKLWYKKYQKNDVVNKEYLLLPDEFTGPLGILNCSISKFIVTQKSSCFVESLIIGVLPILMPDFIETSEKFNNVLDKVTIKKNPTIGKIYTITTNNIKEKIELLKNESIYAETLATMRNDWLCKDYFLLPRAHEALFNLMKDRINEV